jgi:hypothetical protein
MSTILPTDHQSAVRMIHWERFHTGTPHRFTVISHQFNWRMPRTLSIPEFLPICLVFMLGKDLSQPESRVGKTHVTPSVRRQGHATCRTCKHKTKLGKIYIPFLLSRRSTRFLGGLSPVLNP